MANLINTITNSNKYFKQLETKTLKELGHKKDFFEKLAKEVSKKDEKWIHSHLSGLTRAVRYLIKENNINSKPAQTFLEKIANSHLSPKELNDLLTTAIRSGNLALVQRFIKMGARLNDLNSEQQTPLYTACDSGYLDMVKFLIQTGAEVNAIGDVQSHATALHLAAKRGNREIITFLTKRGAKLDVKNKQGFTPFQLSLTQNNSAITAMFLQSESDAEYSNTWNEIVKNGQGLLLTAYKNGHSNMVLKVFENARRQGKLNEIKQTNQITGLAANMGDQKLLSLLMKEVYPTHAKIQSLGYYVSKMNGNDKCLSLFPKKDDLYAEELIERKVLSSFLALDGKTMIDGDSIDLQGAYGAIIHERMANALEQFSFPNSGHLNDDKKNALIKAFKESGHHRSSTTLAKQYQQNQLIVLPASWEKHAVDIVFYKDTMAICNRGEGAGEEGTLVVFKIDPKKVDKEIFKEIKNKDLEDSYQGSEFFYHDLPSKLSPRKDERPLQDKQCHLFQDLISPKFQKGPNCTYASAKAALRFSWSMFAIEDAKEEEQVKILQDVKLANKQFGTIALTHALETYINAQKTLNANSKLAFGLDNDLIKSAMEKSKKRVFKNLKH